MNSESAPAPNNSTRPVVLTGCVAILAFHVLLNAVYPAHSESISYLFFLFWCLAAICICLRRAFYCSPRVVRSWLLFSLGLFFWFIATVMAARSQLFLHAEPTFASIEDFFYFFYGVPILLAIASTRDGQASSLFFWMDGIQSAAVGYVAYIAIFSALPFSRVPLHPVTEAHLVWIYDIENLILAVFAAARLMTTDRGSPERRTFQIVTGYLCIYALCAAIYNHIVVAYIDAGMLDFIVDLPFVVLVCAGLFVSIPYAEESNPRQRTGLALFVDNARPIVLALALCAVSALIVRRHFHLAISVIFGAFILYGMRSAILQSRYLRVQQALIQARDRLENLALQDGLTGIANRRSFDRRVHLEWHRAQRSRSPLSLLLIDIDHFKELNDTYGHLVGDECLVQVANLLLRSLNRPADMLARYGGEEFVALLPDTDADGALIVADTLQAALAHSTPLHSIPAQVTVSIGATTWLEHTYDTMEQLLETADRALYRAKRNGRNRVEFLPFGSSSED